jgi:hypothetical protein
VVAVLIVCVLGVLCVLCVLESTDKRIARGLLYVRGSNTRGELGLVSGPETFGERCAGEEEDESDSAPADFGRMLRTDGTRLEGARGGVPTRT